MARPMKPLVRGGGYYPSNGWTPLVYPGGYTTMDSVGGGDEPIEKTVSGSIVSFSDAIAAPLKALSVAVEPIQDLHGYDNPWPAGGGKNLFNVSSGQSATTRGVTATYDGTNGLIYSGSPTDTGFIGSWVLQTPLTLAAGTYSVSIKTPVNFRFVIVSSWASVADIPSSQNKSTFTISETKTIDRLCLFLDDSSIVGVPINVHIEDIQIETGSTATAFAPCSNICPISGWTEAKVTRTGKNLNPYEGVNFSADTHPAGFWLNAGDYVFSLDTGGSFGNGNSIYIKLKDRDGNVITDGNISGAGWFLNSTRQYYYGFGANFTSAPFTLLTDCFFCFGFNNTRPTANGVQLELGSTATSYEPYQGQTYSITFPSEAGTVYGGTLDVTQGKLTVDRVMLGNVKWSKRNSYSHVFYAPSGTGHVVNSTTGVSNVCVLYSGGTLATFASDSEYRFRIGDRIYINIPSVSNVTDLNTWITNNSLQICFELATPIEITLTPTQIDTLLGTNNVWSDAGDVTVTYLADGNASDAEALGILLGGRYVNNHGEDEPSDREALDIVLGGNK